MSNPMCPMTAASLQPPCKLGTLIPVLQIGKLQLRDFFFFFSLFREFNFPFKVSQPENGEPGFKTSLDKSESHAHHQKTFC